MNNAGLGRNELFQSERNPTDEVFSAFKIMSHQMLFWWHFWCKRNAGGRDLDGEANYIFLCQISGRDQVVLRPNPALDSEMYLQRPDDGQSDKT